MNIFRSLKDIFGGEVFTATDGVPQGKVTGLVGALLGKADLVHVHLFDEILQVPNTDIKTGMMFDFAGDTPPAGYLECNGAEISRGVYPELFGVIGTRYGSSSVNTFKLPDFRERYAAGMSTLNPAGTMVEDAVQVATDQAVSISGSAAFSAKDVQNQARIAYNSGVFGQSVLTTVNGVTARTGGWGSDIARNGNNLLTLNYSKTIDPDMGRRTASVTRPKTLFVLKIIKY